MLSELELEVVKQHKVWGFTAYLQGAWFDFPRLQTDIPNGDYPTKEDLEGIYNRMNKERKEFDHTYMVSLPNAKANPLETEQNAWKLLSPLIKQYLVEFAEFIEAYPPQQIDEGCKEQLLKFTERGWALLQKWNIISNSYKGKYEMSLSVKTTTTYELIEAEEKMAQDLIEELSKKSPESKD